MYMWVLFLMVVQRVYKQVECLFYDSRILSKCSGLTYVLSFMCAFAGPVQGSHATLPSC